MAIRTDFDDARSIQPVFALPPIEIQRTNALLDHQGISSIAPASNTAPSTIPSLAPKLEKPKHYMTGLIKAHQQLEEISDKQTAIFEKQINMDLAEIERLDAEKTAKIRESAKNLAFQTTWSTLSSIAQYIMAGSAAVLGAASIATGGGVVVGSLLIASGVVGVTGRVLHDTGAFDSMAAWLSKSQETREKIASRIEVGFFLLSLGLGLAGGALASQSHLLTDVVKLESVRKIATAVGLGSSFGKGFIDLRVGFLKRKTAILEASIQETSSKIQELYQAIHQENKETQNITRTTKDIADVIKEAIAANNAAGD